MKKMIIFLILAIIVCGCSANASTPVDPNKDYLDIIEQASEITIKEKIISWNKHYDIYVGDEKVAEVQGKIVNNFGDVFTMKDMNGNVLIKEKQIKRWGVKFNRVAEISNSNDELIGYIAEETFTKLTNVGYYFHFLDVNKNHIGVSDQVFFSLLKKYNYSNINDEKEYQVKAQLSLADTYEMSILVDEPQIPRLYAILMVCIQDAIHDAESDE